ncbi:calmodulin-binding transcription activator 1 like protein [Danaus plexippus plexippus]|uniref:Calmodulin-binding transcription activator 1 like protein n=1 Tax=Danaus plexippus plexippus TaxID=278856 RepID=A0A212EP58_DANPL|nr:calmodulin-binding transcription activator 1 like protein [Danaus plexippus plexippus]
MKAELQMKSVAMVQLVEIPSPSDGEPIKLPENLESLPRAEHFAAQRHRWNTNEKFSDSTLRNRVLLRKYGSLFAPRDFSDPYSASTPI